MTDGFFPSVGDTLAGKYQLTRELGRGSMGAVFEATHLRLSQRVAVKVMLPWVIERPELAYRFEQEARAAAQLRGPHTVRVLDVDTSPEGLPFLVMEHLAGRCLRQESEQRGPLPVEEAVRYVLEACEGMCEAHAAGIVHRDLKPSNLFVSEEGGRRVVKVLDFGVAKAFGDTNASFRTATNAHLGTYRYMSPEQARSARSVDGRSDVWSLGVVLYELLAGFAPFKGEGAVGTLVAIATQAPPPLLERRPDVPAALVAVIERALCKDAGGRYQTMRDFADALAPFCQASRPSSASIVPPRPAASSPSFEPPRPIANSAPLAPSRPAANSAPIVAPRPAANSAPIAPPRPVASSASSEHPLHSGASVSLVPQRGAGSEALPAPPRGGVPKANEQPPRRVPIGLILAPPLFALLIVSGIVSARISHGRLFDRPGTPGGAEISADKPLGAPAPLGPPTAGPGPGATRAEAAPGEPQPPANPGPSASRPSTNPEPSAAHPAANPEPSSPADPESGPTAPAQKTPPASPSSKAPAPPGSASAAAAAGATTPKRTPPTSPAPPARANGDQASPASPNGASSAQTGLPKSTPHRVLD
jgi:eukaryotic-like serine/threonine-protein kinase